MRQKLIYLIIAISALLIGIVAYYVGSMLLAFLFTVIILCFFCFFISLTFESIINPNAGSNTQKAAQKNTYLHITSWPAVIAISIAYIFSLFVIKCYQLPGGTQPYFNNTDYHGIMNTGVSFGDHLVLYTPDTAYKSEGLWASEDGFLKLRNTYMPGNYKLVSENFYQPVFYQPDSARTHYVPVNNLYPEPFEKGVSIVGDNFRLSCLQLERKDVDGWLKRKLRGPKYVYDVAFAIEVSDTAILSSNRLKDVFRDTVRIDSVSITKGKSLSALLIENDSSVYNRALSKRILNDLLVLLDHPCLLANGEADSAYLTFFPGQRFFENKFRLEKNGTVLQPVLNTTVDIYEHHKFFVGFYNDNELLDLRRNTDTLLYSNETRNYLEFLPPKYYPLSASVEHPQLGVTQTRFLCNHYTQLEHSNFTEGFLFNNNMRVAAPNIFNATINYQTGSPGKKLEFYKSSDYDSSSTAPVLDSRLSVTAADKKTKWLFAIRDFSQNAFTYNKVIPYLSVLYLFIVWALIWAPSYEGRRIESAVYLLLYAFIVFRFLLLWRVATFPPMHGISTPELDTLLDFDTRFVGSVHIYNNWPFTLVGPIILILTILLFRSQLFTKLINGLKRIGSKLKRSPASADNKPLPSRSRISILLIGISDINPFVRLHLLVLAVSFLMLYAPAEIVVRIFGIVVPLVSYFYFTYLTIWNDVKISAAPEFRFAFLNYIKNRISDIIETPVFWLSLSTFVFLIKVDRGFAILFGLYLLLKNVIFGIKRLTFYRSKTDSKLRPYGLVYFIYGLIAYGLYLFILSYKPLFNNIYSIRFYIITGVPLMTAVVLLLRYRAALVRITAVVFILFSVVATTPWLYNKINRAVESSLNHVVYRASVIYMPISDIISSHRHNSFEERKIIETAEGQWFIGSFLNKPYDFSSRINLRQHFNKGVDYSTQTRDVVLARYVIPEFGSLIMLLLLLLTVVPVFLFAISYPINESSHNKLNAGSYILGSAAMLLFTLSFFVWLTSTNRFVFFGQDFPFLSLTSKVSLILPLFLLLIILLADPATGSLNKTSLRYTIGGYVFLALLIALFVGVAGKSNMLDEKDFHINLSKTEQAINVNLNKAFEDVQNTKQPVVENTGKKTPVGLNNDFSPEEDRYLKNLVNSKAYQEIYDTADVYTKSIFDILKLNPQFTLKPESPIYLRYDEGTNKYSFEYNCHLHLEPSPYDNNQAWHGNIYGQNGVAGPRRYSLMFGNSPMDCNGLPFERGAGAVKVLVIPQKWISDTSAPVALIAIQNTEHDEHAEIQISNLKAQKQRHQGLKDFVTCLTPADVALVTENHKSYAVAFRAGDGQAFMRNFWVNGRERKVYPLGKNLFWIYHFANATEKALQMAQKYDQDIHITLDYNLTDNVQKYMNSALKNRNRNSDDFKYSVIAADGNGKITLIADYVTPLKRKVVDPNDDIAVNKILTHNFFFINKNDEICQWANVNLNHLDHGPGSSVKPLILAAVASQANAGWEHLKLKESHQFVDREVHHYAGFDLHNQAWKEEDAGENSDADIHKYIYKSNNIYHSLIMFLGSYPRSAFGAGNNCSLKNVLYDSVADENDKFPEMDFSGHIYHFYPFTGNRDKDKWPKTNYENPDVKTYFGNASSILGEGLNNNLDLLVGDNDKDDHNLKSNKRVDIAGHGIYDSLEKDPDGNFWAFPEQSFFIQLERAKSDIESNFLTGMKSSTLGGNPYQISPVKMAEMYGKLVSQNSKFALHISEDKNFTKPWSIDTSWQNDFSGFLRKHVFTSMDSVLIKGTAANLYKKLDHKKFYLYAKTGTIGEESNRAGGRVSKDSKRLALIISKNPLDGTNNTNNRFYVIYFTINNYGDMRAEDYFYDTYANIISLIENSDSFKNYMQ